MIPLFPGRIYLAWPALLLAACQSLPVPPVPEAVPQTRFVADVGSGFPPTPEPTTDLAGPAATVSVSISPASGHEGPNSRPAGEPAARPAPTLPAERPVSPRLSPAQRATLPSLFARVRAGFALPALDDPAIERMAAYYARKKVLELSAPRAKLYLHHFVQEAERRGLPTELALLPYVESAFNPLARSPAGAVGACQFMPATGRRFGLAQSAWVDLRRDFTRCSLAMFDYLEENYRKFGDYHLALAAYNAGEGAVARAMARNALEGKPTDYASLPLPQETRLYVPALLAFKRLIEAPEAFLISLPDIPNRSAWSAVPLVRDMDAQVAAKLAGVSLETLHALNPALNRPVIPRSALPHLVLPVEAAERFRLAQSRSRGLFSMWTAYRVAHTTRLGPLASRFKLKPALLRELNGIPPTHQVLAGSTLLVPRAGKGAMNDIPPEIALNGSVASEPEPVARKKLRKTRAHGRQHAGHGRTTRQRS